MKILFILDPLEKLKLTWDSSIYLLRELTLRGHENWIADTPDIRFENGHYFANAKRAHPVNLDRGSWDEKDDYSLRLEAATSIELTSFDHILIRKEPPFDDSYLYLTHLLERVTDKVSVMNHPRGIRNTNEKLGILLFPDWIPETIVTSSTEQILHAQNEMGADLVIKPLDLKGGQGVTLLPYSEIRSNREGTLDKLTCGGKETVMAQRFIPSKGVTGDKRILIFDYKIWAAYERHAPENDFRSNVAVGGTYHPSKITEKEKALVLNIIPYLRKQGLVFVGIDVLNEKLIEINVTCSAGLCECKKLYPNLDLVGQWAEYLENS